MCSARAPRGECGRSRETGALTCVSLEIVCVARFTWPCHSGQGAPSSRSRACRIDGPLPQIIGPCIQVGCLSITRANKSSPANRRLTRRGFFLCSHVATSIYKPRGQVYDHFGVDTDLEYGRLIGSIVYSDLHNEAIILKVRINVTLPPPPHLFFFFFFFYQRSKTHQPRTVHVKLKIKSSHCCHLIQR